MGIIKQHMTKSTRAQENRNAQLLLTIESLAASDFSWIDRSIKEAAKSKHRVRVGAILIRGSKIVVAHNRIRNSPDISYVHATTHAEMGTLKRIDSAKGATIYVARIGKLGSLLPSFPCYRCFPALVEAGVRRIVWWNGERWVRGKI